MLCRTAANAETHTPAPLWGNLSMTEFSQLLKNGQVELSVAFQGVIPLVCGPYADGC